MIPDTDALLALARPVRLLLMDVDGVMTDGRIVYDSDGRELKFFHVRDGHGLKLLVRNGIDTGVITGRSSAVVAKRAAELSMAFVRQGVHRKGDVLGEIMAEHGLKKEEIAFIGDDIVDIPVFRRVGFSACVPDAPYEVRAEVDYVTMNHAGRGAVREVCELILKAKGLWEPLLGEYRL